MCSYIKLCLVSQNELCVNSNKLSCSHKRPNNYNEVSLINALMLYFLKRACKLHTKHPFPFLDVQDSSKGVTHLNVIYE